MMVLLLIYAFSTGAVVGLLLGCKVNVRVYLKPGKEIEP